MDEGNAPPHEAIFAVVPSTSYTLAVGLGLPMGFLVIFLYVRKCLFFLTWRSFRDGPYVVGQHQWRPGNLTGCVSHIFDFFIFPLLLFVSLS